MSFAQPPTIFVAAANSLRNNMTDPTYKCDGVDDHLQIQAAIDALPSDGGRVVLSEGKFNVATAPVINKTDISLEGLGYSTILMPAGDGLSLVGADRCNIGNMRITGGATGISIVGAKDSIFHELLLDEQTASGIVVDGDAPTETVFRDITMRDVDGIGFSYVRTNVDDSGGIYMDRVRTIRGAGSTLGFSLASSAGSETASFIFMDQCVADGYVNTALLIDNLAQVRVSQSWFAQAASATDPCVDIDGSFAVTIDGGTSMQGGAATGFALSLRACHEVILNDVMFGGSCDFAINAEAGINGIYLGQHHNFLASGDLTNSEENLYSRTVFFKQGPVAFVTRPSGGTFDVMAILDADTVGGAPKYIRNSNGTLQFLNTAFDASILELLDNAELRPVDLRQTGPNLGFYNHATSTQQVLATGAAATVDDVITALQALGLVAQS